MTKYAKCCKWTTDDPIIIKKVGNGEWWKDPQVKKDFLKELNARFKFLPNGEIERKE